MDDLIDSIYEFVKVRQLNIVIVALLSIVYMMYQYRRFFFKGYYDSFDDDEYGDYRPRLSRSRSRSYSRSRSRPRSTSSYRNYKLDDNKNTRRGRKSQRRGHAYND
ncbi:PREDICTED: uncharacterized protein LOC106100002 [Papilio polytes]|uniref:uncharacterized protein LOC106100002 n=1 Tax=Papilio polytes TaxID=76194 RepID=UPI0006762224|nr:PREDICTED: uncharacterized protein LOC106100002 [Papilio polytes]